MTKRNKLALLAFIVTLSCSTATSLAQLEGLLKKTTDEAARRLQEKAAEAAKDAATPARPLSAELAKFENHVATQKHDVWCWLACAEMVHHYNGRTGEQYTQVGLAKKIQGIESTPQDPKVKSGALMQVMAALSPTSEVKIEGVGNLIADLATGQNPLLDKKVTPDPISLVFAISDMTSSGADLIIDELSIQKKPVVALLKPEAPGGVGHAVVLYGVEWRTSSTSLEGLLTDSKKREIVSVKVADPWYVEDERIRTLTGKELKDRGERFLTEQQARSNLENLNKALNAKK